MGDLIEFFQKVHKECAPDSAVKAKMAIVSGSTFILFDGQYGLREKTGHGKVIAFNAANNLYTRPDSSYVKPLGSYKFPGTIISIRFPLSNTSAVSMGDK
jgi:hypothetical protein